MPGSIFKKLKYFNGVCNFCASHGLSYGVTGANNQTVAVCDPCAKKLIIGIGTALAEMDRLEREKNGTKQVEIVT